MLSSVLQCYILQYFYIRLAVSVSQSVIPFLCATVCEIVFVYLYLNSPLHSHSCMCLCMFEFEFACLYFSLTLCWNHELQKTTTIISSYMVKLVNCYSQLIVEPTTGNEIEHLFWKTLQIYLSSGANCQQSKLMSLDWANTARWCGT